MPTLRVEVESAAVLDGFYKTIAQNYATDSGFDLYCPEDCIIPAGATVFVDLGVRCQMEGGTTHGYYLYPRSSLSKTPLRLANSVGIIDAGYRGTLKAAVDNRSNVDYAIKKGDRLFQICMPSLEPFGIVFGAVDRATERGEGGMGSTGRGTGAAAAAPTMSAAAVAIARGAGLRDPNPTPYNIHYTYFT